MHSTLFHLGPLTIHAYGVMMALGFLAGLASWTWLGRREGRTFNVCSDLLFWIMVSGLLGARLAYVAANWPEFAANPVDVVRVDQGGLIYYGGFLGSGLALLIYARHRREPVIGLLDFVVTSLPLAHAFGRVGCFFHGCCHGRPYDGALAVTFPGGSLPWSNQVQAHLIGSDAPRTQPVHPVQLYEAVFNLLLYALLVLAYRRRTRPGDVLALYLLVYPAGRFALEFFRGDPRAPWMGMTVAQGVSLVLFLIGLGLALARRARPGKAS